MKNKITWQTDNKHKPNAGFFKAEFDDGTFLTSRIIKPDMDSLEIFGVIESFFRAVEERKVESNG